MSNYKMELVWAIINMFMHVFQYTLAQLFIWNNYLGRLKVQVTLKSQIMKR